MATATNTGKRQRTCIACGAQADKTGLLRIVRTPRPRRSMPPAAHRDGARTCAPQNARSRVQRNKLDRALKATLGSDDYDRIAADVAAQALRQTRGKCRGVVYGQHAST